MAKRIIPKTKKNPTKAVRATVRTTAGKAVKAAVKKGARKAVKAVNKVVKKIKRGATPGRRSATLAAPSKAIKKMARKADKAVERASAKVAKKVAPVRKSVTKATGRAASTARTSAQQLERKVAKASPRKTGQLALQKKKHNKVRDLTIKVMAAAITTVHDVREKVGHAILGDTADGTPGLENTEEINKAGK